MMKAVVFALCLGAGAATCRVTTALGCYDDSGSRLFNDFSQLGSDTTPMTHDICAQLCHDHVGISAVAGVEFAHQCFCAKTLPSTAKKVDGCNMACSANATENCGDSGKLYAYEFDCSGKPTPPPPAPRSPAGFCPDYDREYCQPGVPLDERIRRLMAHMTTQDKMDTMAERSIAGTYSDGSDLVARQVGWWQESLHGLRTGCGPGANSSDCATQFAEANAMSCAFNTSLVHDTADAISTEARAFFAAGHLGGLTFFAPQINMASNPLWGRNMETPGEDPHLSAAFARSYVDGLQGPAARAGGNGNGSSPVWKTVATPKHFVGQFFEGDGSDPWRNGTTVNRQSNDTRYTLQDLEQYYLPSFRAALVDAKAGSLMCAYQGVNGVPMCANGFILNRVVRESWGWEGFVVSDCDAIKTMMVRGSPGGNDNFGHAYSLTGAMAVQDGVRAGCDSNCGDPYRRFGAQAVSEGMVTPAELDASVRRLLRPMFLMGLFDNPATQSPSYTNYSWTDVRSPAHRQLALEGARQSLVLLALGSRAGGADTAPAPLLPLRPGGRVLVTGPHYNATMALIGNYNGPPCQEQAGRNDGDAGSCLTSVLQAVQAVNDGTAGGATKAVAGMTDPCKTLPDDDAGIAAAAAAAGGSDVDTVVLVLGGACHEGEGTDRDSLDLPGSQQTLFDAIYNATAGGTTDLVVVLLNGGPYGIDAIKALTESELYESSGSLSPRGAVAVLQANFPGQEGAQAIAEALYGRTNDFGKLTTTVYPRRYAHGEPLGGTPWMDSRLRPHAGDAAQGFPAGRSEGRTHMFYTGTPLWPFGYGLSYTTFDLAWAAGTNGTNAASLPLANVSAGLPALSFTVRVTNTGPTAGKEIVLAYWCPPNDVDSDLRQQLVGFNGVRLEPGKSAELTFSLPTARELATVTPTGDRVFLPGAYAVRFSRGHGKELQTEVRVVDENATTVGGSSDQVLLSSFPTRWVDGHEVTVDACTEGTSDVIAHTEDWLVDYKRWSWVHSPSGANQPGTGRLEHVASGMCLQREPTADGGSLALRACANDSVGTAQEWSYAQLNGTFSDPHDAVACLTTAARNTSALRANVTVGGGCASDGARWFWDVASGFVRSALPGAVPLCLAARAEGVFNQAS